MTKLYNQYRSKVPDPNSPTPGFKEPRRIRIEYITARTDSDYYKELIDHVQYNRVRQAFDGGLPGDMAGGGVVPWLSLAGALAGDPWSSFRVDGDQLAADYGEALADRRAGAVAAASWSALLRRPGRVVGRAGRRPGVRRRSPGTRPAGWPPPARRCR